MPADLVIRDVRIVDGSGGPAVEGDVSVEGGRITAVGSVPGGGATVELDGEGLVLAPGFVDTHTHDDAAVVAHPGLAFKLSQGVTSLVLGNCGNSAFPVQPGAANPLLGGFRADWSDLPGYVDVATSRRPALNAITLIGHNTMRRAAMGDEQRPPTAEELARMRGWVAEAMEHGACGLSTGLIYTPGRYSDTEEVIALAEAVAPFQGLYATHMRNEADRLLDAVDEAIRIGREAQVGVHISHHKAAMPRNWGKVADSLARVDAANAAGSDVTLDVYPYTAGSGRMVEYFTMGRIDEEFAGNILIANCPAFRDYEGRMIPDIAADLGVPVTEAVERILSAPRGDRTICIHFIIDEADIETNLRHPLMMIGSDGIPDLNGKPHPRLFGTFPRVLGEYVRARGVLSLEEAVRRMTSLAAERFGLSGRGRVAEGCWADLVVFDPDRIADTATYADPKQEAVGVAWVVVNGQVAYDYGRHTGVGAGRMLRYREEG